MADGIEQLASYMIIFNPNGGSGAPPTGATDSSGKYAIPSTKPTRTGFEFLGWATDSKATSATHKPGTTYTFTRSTTLYAVWSALQPPSLSDATATRISDTRADITWMTSFTGYAQSIKVERSTDGGTYTQIASVSRSATSYADATVSANHWYRYRLRSYNPEKGYSAYSYSGYIYNTPAAPTKVTAARESEAEISLAIDNPALTATALRVERSTDGETWEHVGTVSGNAVKTFTDSPGNVVCWYRARNERGELVSGWSPTSNPIATLAPPLAPTLVSPASGATVSSADENIRFAWLHNAPDGSRQRNAEIEWSSDDGRSGYASVVGDREHYDFGNIFAPNTTVTWRAQTGGAHPSNGAWSEYRAFTIKQPPSVSLTLGSARERAVAIAETTTVEIGETAIFTARVEGLAEGVSITGYQWSFSDDGITWYVSSAAGATTDAVSAVAAEGRTGRRYRCAVTLSDGTTLTTPAIGFQLDDVPVTDFTIRNTPVLAQVAYDDVSGTLANMRIQIALNGATVYEADMGTATRLEIPRADWLPVDGEIYDVTVTARSSSTLTTTASYTARVSFVLPMAATIDIIYDDETGYASLTVGIAYDEGREDAESIAVYRVYDGRRKMLAEGLSAGSGVVDVYAPLNVPYAYEAVTFADSGAACATSFEARFPSTWWFVYHEGGMAKAMWEPTGKRTPTRTKDEIIERDGSTWPILIQGRTLSHKVNMSGWVETKEEADSFEAMAFASGGKVYKGLKGEVFHCHAEASITDCYDYDDDSAEIDVTVTRVRGGDL